MSKPLSYRSTVSALAIGQIVCWAALYYAFSSFVLPMRADMGWTEPQLMGAFTLGLAVWGAASYGAGAAIDRGRGAWVLGGGAALGGIGFILWSQVDNLAGLYLAWALLGVAMAMTLYEPAFAVLTRRFPERYVKAITTLTLVGGFASTLSFPAAAWLQALWGWRGALLGTGLVLLVLIAPLHLLALRGTHQLVRLPAAQHEPADATLRDALREPAFWLLTACFTLYAFAIAALWAYIVPILADKGRSAAEAVAIVVWFGPAQVAGRLLYLGWLGLGRRLTSRLLGMVVLAVMPVSLAVLAMAESTPALVLFAVLFGLSNGLTTIVRGSIVPDFFGRGHVGRISGAMSGISLFARAGAPLAAAWALVAFDGYRSMLLGLAAVGVAALLAFAWAQRPASLPVVLGADTPR